MMYRILIAATACLVLCITVNAGQFYKWVDANGVTHYSADPPDSGEAGVLDIKLPPPGAVAPAPPRSAAAPPTATRTQKPVVIYTAEWCGVCHSAKRYFSERHITYTEYDVEKTAKGRDDFQRMDGKAVPIVLVGETRMDGFSPAHFEALMR